MESGKRYDEIVWKRLYKKSCALFVTSSTLIALLMIDQNKIYIIFILISSCYYKKCMILCHDMMRF